MKGGFGEWLGRWPENYVYNVLNRAGLKEPPYDEFEIADILGLKIEQYEKDSDIAKWFETASPAAKQWLEKSGTCMQICGSQPIIFTPAYFSPERKRMNIFHECGHAILPWHNDECFVCKDRDIDLAAHKIIEREAFASACSFLMPRQHFINLIRELKSINFASIKLLRKFYHTSIEATASWYAQNHPGICSFLVLDPTNLEEPDSDMEDLRDPAQTLLELHEPLPASHRVVREPIDCPLKISYAIRSRRFTHRLKRNYGIGYEHPFYQTWKKCKSGSGEIPALSFGWFNSAPLRYECLPVGGFHKKMMVLLWEEDPQPPLLIHVGHYAA